MSGRSIVVGAGIAGAFVALQFARQGLQVTLMDAEGIPNMDSPSAGDTRVFRMAYFEAPEYVPFLKSAKEEWLELAGESDVPIFEECGVLMVGAEDSDLIQGGKRSLEAFPTRAEILSGAELRERYPHISLRSGEWGILDLEGGFLHATRAYQAVLNACKEAEVEFRPYSRVTSVQEDSEGVVVNGVHHSDFAVICCGMGVGELGLGESSLWKAKQLLTYWDIEPRMPEGAWEGHPVFAFSQDGVLFYGMPPNASSKGVKVAEHRQVRVEASGDDSHATLVARVRAVVEERFCERSENPVATKACHYDMTDSRDLAFGLLPGSGRIGVIGSMSGHGFKLAPAVAEAVVAELMDVGSGMIPEKLGVGKLFKS